MALSSSWNGGYTATFTITNSGTTTVPTWSLGFTLPSGGTLGSLWNGTSTVSGASVSVTPAGWNASLAPGAKATVGFEKLGEATGAPPKSLIRMFGPNGNPQARNLFSVIGYLQRHAGIELRVAVE